MEQNGRVRQECGLLQGLKAWLSSLPGQVATLMNTCLNSDEVGGVDASLRDLQVLERDQFPLSGEHQYRSVQR